MIADTIRAVTELIRVIAGIFRYKDNKDLDVNTESELDKFHKLPKEDEDERTKYWRED